MAPPRIDLFEVQRCGLCVHRNAPTDAVAGSCTPVGERGPQDPACAWFFGRAQLAADHHGRSRR